MYSQKHSMKQIKQNNESLSFCTNRKIRENTGSIGFHKVAIMN